MKKKKKNRLGIGVVFVTVAALFIAITVQKNDLVMRDKELKEEKARCDKEYESLIDEQQDIEEYKNYVNSDEYIEDIARKKLGLVYPDEIIFEAEE